MIPSNLVNTCNIKLNIKFVDLWQCLQILSVKHSVMGASSKNDVIQLESPPVAEKGGECIKHSSYYLSTQPS